MSEDEIKLVADHRSHRSAYNKLTKKHNYEKITYRRRHLNELYSQAEQEAQLKVDTFLKDEECTRTSCTSDACKEAIAILAASIAYKGLPAEFFDDEPDDRNIEEDWEE